jgi:hypothetical protein
MAAVAANIAATVVLWVGAYLLIRGAPLSRKRRNTALDEVLKRGGEYRERQKVVGITDSEWSVKVPSSTGIGGGTNGRPHGKPTKVTAQIRVNSGKDD